VFAAHRAGEPAATLGVDAYRADLIRALAALAHAHTPDVIVVGGGPVVDHDPITPGLTGELTPHLFAGYNVDVRAAALGDHAALLGLAAGDLR
jgi:predicted NBD/HSP70 family sugar kinase